MTAVVGGSGAGKSTLLYLLARLYDPTAGEIRVDGVPLPELDLAAWRSRLAFAGQDLELMGDTVRANIAFGRSGATLDEIVAAARQGDAHGFISELPQGYDTRIGERGLRLSAGQRQRIGLARALVRKPEILILDEATNALDSLSERVIQHALEQLAGNLTMIVVAHRLSTIRLANHVIVLDEGRLVEQGPPDTLLRANRGFAHLWHLQLNAFGDNANLTECDEPSDSARISPQDA
jgi:subfamily B ATP-binding cassette protein MsbA